MIFSVLLVAVSGVCASDVNDTIDMNTEMSNINVTSLDMSHQSANATSGSFDELKSNIESLNPGDVLNIHKDYSLDNDSNIAIASCIAVKADNVTINGNGHYINGNNHPVSFKITGNNVKIFDWGFCNCQGYGKTLKVNIDGNSRSIKYMDNKSPVYWLGDNGIMSDCIFSKNSGVNGGAVTWMGNNGCINRVIFQNNKAKGAGGAIYLNGKNNNLCNCVFRNSTSQLFNESVFLDNTESFNISKNYCDALFLIDGSQFNIGVDNLCKVYYSQFAQKEFNIVPIIYSSLIMKQFILDNI
ncbi:hypothetical protein [uncultured Methanobrevibacter sp.]|uniref:hypothetical protein n=1 Tax=uncultured Methanobrevibacter sp. TaxID=253161 RepID=UPI0025EB92D0|nr:hypothetical protein [uncultured Methanobrevibacter sp.]